MWMNVGMFPLRSISVCQLDSSLSSTKVEPKGTQTGTDQSSSHPRHINSLLNIDDQLVFLVQFSAIPIKMLSKVGIDSPVTNFVGVSQSAFGYLAPNPHPVELAVFGSVGKFTVSRRLSR